MFNHHFFGGEASSAVLDAFLRELDGKKVMMVVDPPFGGLVKPLANSFSLISQTWRKLQNSGQQLFNLLLSLLLIKVYCAPMLLKTAQRYQ
ncbi:rRNA N6-adenosine-methyltransferase zcchc4 [Ameca splendens]|uniref:rRNA N6-adenosine-methyltransferase zcchc4 n=1 Tax=Ameca splendens TaxID=208324 RepID=A0ABV0YRY1_9TELE